MEIKRILLCLLGLWGSLSSQAQLEEAKAYYYGYDVNGLIIGKEYTPDDFIAVLGQPTSIRKYNSDIGGYNYTLFYGDDLFRTSGGIFNEFLLKTDRFSILGGKVKVGKELSSITNIQGMVIFITNNEKFSFSYDNDEGRLWVKCTPGGDPHSTTIQSLSYSIRD